MEWPKCSSVGMDKEDVVYIKWNIIQALKKGGNPALWDKRMVIEGRRLCAINQTEKDK